MWILIIFDPVVERSSSMNLVDYEVSIGNFLGYRGPLKFRSDTDWCLGLELLPLYSPQFLMEPVIFGTAIDLSGGMKSTDYGVSFFIL